MRTPSLRHGPLRLALSGGLWASAWYLLGYLAVGGALFAIALGTAVAGGLLSTAEDPLRQAKHVLARPGPLSPTLRA